MLDLSLHLNSNIVTIFLIFLCRFRSGFEDHIFCEGKGQIQVGGIFKLLRFHSVRPSLEAICHCVVKQFARSRQKNMRSNAVPNH